MSTFDADRVTRQGLAAALVATPVIWLASGIICPPLKTDAGKQLAVVAAHPDRWYWFTLLLLVGELTLIPALFGIMRLLRTRSPKLALIGGWLAQFGALVAIGDASSQFITWLMVRSGQDPVQMTRLLDRMDSSAAANIAYTVGGPAIMLGILLLSIGLYRSRVAPRWVPVMFFLACAVNIVAFSNSVTVGVTASYVLMLAPMAVLARLVVSERVAVEPAYAGTRPAPVTAEL
jgi:hypothetical protein